MYPSKDSLTVAVSQTVHAFDFCDSPEKDSGRERLKGEFSYPPLCSPRPIYLRLLPRASARIQVFFGSTDKRDSLSAFGP